MRQSRREESSLVVPNKRRLLHGCSLLEQCRSNCRVKLTASCSRPLPTSMWATQSGTFAATTRIATWMWRIRTMQEQLSRAGPKFPPSALVFAHVEQPYHAHIAFDYRDIVVRATQEAKAELEKILVSGSGDRISVNRP